ncbi:hypothetical protein AAFF_G00271510 [Aldrovandia affinis]|uniref:Uncharacterized protein n=1 Tax=Aldrovandia affinis TaxID=143900 RepID=A0AAD7W1L4_9TELE|nr:hypothetical protein AAFF_G00271510 [Aldrovandia affinis]
MTAPGRNRRACEERPGHAASLRAQPRGGDLTHALRLPRRASINQRPRIVLAKQPLRSRPRDKGLTNAPAPGPSAQGRRAQKGGFALPPRVSSVSERLSTDGRPPGGENGGRGGNTPAHRYAVNTARVALQIATCRGLRPPRILPASYLPGTHRYTAQIY